MEAQARISEIALNKGYTRNAECIHHTAEAGIAQT